MRKKLSLFFILLFAAMLITGGSSPVLASRQVVVDDELDPIVRNIHNILPDTDEAENYCADVRDIRMTTLDRDACSQKQLQAILIRKADVVFKISANHKVTKKLKIVSVAGTSLQKVKKATVSSGYRAILVQLNVGMDQGKIKAKNHIVTQVEANLYLFHAVQKETTSKTERRKTAGQNTIPSSKRSGGNTASDAGISAAGTGGTSVMPSQDSGPSSVQGKTSDGIAKGKNRSSGSRQKKNVSKIQKKSQKGQKPSQPQLQNGRVNGSAGEESHTSRGTDRLAIVLWSTAGLAAAFFVIWLFSDWRMIQWYHRKTALQKKK